MPTSYFRQVSIENQILHMRSLSAQFDPETNEFLRAGAGRVVLQNIRADGDLEVTYMDFTGKFEGLLSRQVEELEASQHSADATGNNLGRLSRVKVFTSTDQKLAFNVFTFKGHSHEPLPNIEEQIAPPLVSAAENLPDFAQHIAKYADALLEAHESGDADATEELGMEWCEALSKESIAAFVGKGSRNYVVNTGPRSFLQQKLQFDKVAGTEDTSLQFERADLPVASIGLLGSGAQPLDTKADIAGASDFENGWWLKIAITNSVPLTALKKILALFKRRGVEVERMHLDRLEAGTSGETQADTVTMLRMLVAPPKTVSEEDSAKYFSNLEREMKRLKWVDDFTLDLAYRNLSGPPAGAAAVENVDSSLEVGVERAEVITCLSSILRSLLSKQDVWAFSKTNIDAVVKHPRYLRHAAGIADLFMARFDPTCPLPDHRYHAWVATLREEVESEVQEDAVAKEVLHRMISVLEATLRTNLFLSDRYALSLRLATDKLFTPGAFDAPYVSECGASSPGSGADASRGKQADTPPTPYGVFFVHGRRFNGFHVRFRDIARGGMRLVTPASVEQLAIESARHYDEAYGLANAQQMKNKDIPEGGSKCVVLVDSCTHSSEHKELIVRKAVKAFTDAILDLIVDTPTTRTEVVDYLGKQELVYLGPDEQVIPADINWIVKRAAERGYPIPSAFMSSKPDAGINHKVYGVTSEGVQVFLDVALKELGMHPDTQREDKAAEEGDRGHTHFTVKMTGGPDGDVAGNMIKILQREYGDAARIVGIADATGSAEDPNGLDPNELLRLVEEELPIARFNPAKLGADSGLGEGRLYVCDPTAHATASAAEEALKMRNTMHNRIVADAFIPAGGRPATIHEGNWKAYLQSNGKPSSKLIVEGANLFLTPGARAALHAHTGIPIVKDSSANKCGVICSSFEIMSSMLLSDAEFGAEKEALVADVLARLRLLARREAELLFREFKSLPGSLPDFSGRISEAINRVTDAIAEELDNSTGGNYGPYMQLVKEHMPEKLTELAGDRLAQGQVPTEYLKRAIASTLASRIVYAEGVTFVEQHSSSKLAPLAFEYLKAEKAVAMVLEALDTALWSDSDADTQQIAREIVSDGGVRSFLERRGGLAK